MHQDLLWVYVEKKSRNIKIRLEEADGTTLEFVPVGDCNFVPGHTFSCDLKLVAPCSNTQGGKLSAQTNPQAYYLCFNSLTYTLKLTKGSGETKIYRLTEHVPLTADKKGRARATADFCLKL